MNNSAAQIILFEWPMLICEMLAFGLASFAIAIAPRDASEAALTARVLTILRWLTVAAIISAPLDLARQVADMASVSIFEAVPLVPEVLLGSHAGKVWIARLCVLAVLAVVVALPRFRRVQFTIVAILAGLLLILRAVASHAIDKGLVAVTLYTIHEMFAALWIGSLLGLWIAYAAFRESSPHSFPEITRQVSRLAGISVAAIAATGLYAAYDSIGLRVSNLIDSAYGRTLSLKVAIAAVAILVGGYNRMRLVPALDARDARLTLRNNLAMELVVLAIVIGCSVVLANTPPPH